MIRLSVFYPTTEGATFDHDYYRDRHVPLAAKTWGLDGAEIDRGVSGPFGEAPIPGSQLAQSGARAQVLLRLAQQDPGSFG